MSEIPRDLVSSGMRGFGCSTCSLIPPLSEVPKLRCAFLSLFPLPPSPGRALIPPPCPEPNSAPCWFRCSVCWEPVRSTLRATQARAPRPFHGVRRRASLDGGPAVNGQLPNLRLGAVSWVQKKQQCPEVVLHGTDGGTGGRSHLL